LDTVYKGIKTNNGGPQVVWKDSPPSDGPPRVILDPGPSQKLWNHSPDGFQWGYEGSGSGQLALALLLDVTNNPDLSVRLHQAFKRHFVAAWGQTWQISHADIETWIEGNN